MASVRDRHDDSRTTITTRRGDGDNVTKVTRYVIREEDDNRSSYTTRSRREPRQVPEYVERDLVISRDNSPRRSHFDESDRELTIRRRTETNDGRREERDLTITKVDERRDERVSSPRERYQDRDRDLHHYSRTTDYYSPSQPQTIVIRQDPIIIRERLRDDDYQMVRRPDYDEERSVVRRDERRDERREDPRDEEYFYEKRVRERIDDPRDDRRNRREISPGDSISQVGRRRDYSSDDSMVYVRKVKEEYDSRESSPDRKKNLAAGVIAGVGAAELIRSHRKKEGKGTSGGIGRIGRDVGAGALGALAAEGIQRARSEYRSRSRRRRGSGGSRDRSWSGDRGRYRSRSRGSHRSRSRSESRSKLKTLGALGLGAAAIAAAAAIANRNKGKEEKVERKGRPHRRQSSVSSSHSLENDPTADDARNPKHRNQRIAAAGAVGAAGAALLDRANNKRQGSRSPSRVRQGLPIVAAGLGTAALAGLYERNKAKREAEKIQKEQKREARSRSRSRSRAGSRAPNNDTRSGPPSGFDERYIEYGNDPMYGNNYGPGYYGQAPPQEPYYNSQAMVPAETSRGPRSRSRSVSRDRGGRRSMSASDEDRRDGRRSRDGLAAAGAAGAGGVAAAHHERKKQERKERKARKRELERQGSEPPPDEGYQPQTFNPLPAPGADQYPAQGGYYPSTSQFPPPPGSMPQQSSNRGTPQPQMAQYPSTQSNPFNGSPGFNYQNDPYGNGQGYNPQNYSTQSFGAPHNAPQHNQGYDQYPTGPNQYAPPQNRGTDENVSAGSSFPQRPPSDQHQFDPDGLTNSRSGDQLPRSRNVVPPSTDTPGRLASASVPNLTVPSTYVPPNERPDSPPAKHVHFPSASEDSRAVPESNHTSDTETMSPDSRRQRRRTHEVNRGYEASEDTDTSATDDPRPRPHDIQAERDRANGSGSNSGRNRDRRNSHREDDRDRNDRRFSKHKASRDIDNGDDSDATIELEPRFDDKGRKRASRGDDPLADKLDDILAGKGIVGKMFGNYMDGLTGGGKDRKRSK